METKSRGVVAEGSAGTAARAIRQTRPFNTASQEAAISILLAAERLRREVTRIVEPYGITHQQYNVLRILRGAHPDPLPTLEVASRMIEATPGVTRLLDRLEEKEWVTRARCLTDRRQVHVRITTRGLELLTTMEAQIAAADESLSNIFNDEELQTLITLLARVIEGLDPSSC